MKLKWELFSSKNQQGVENVNAMARVIGWDERCVEENGKLKPDHKALLLKQVKALGIKVAEGENPFIMVRKSDNYYCKKLTHILYFKKLEQAASDKIKAIDTTIALDDPGKGFQWYLKSALWSQYVDSIDISISPDPQGNVVATLGLAAFAAQGRATVSQQRVDSTSQEPSVATSADNDDEDKLPISCNTQ